MRDLDLPRGEERELVVCRDRVYELDGDDRRTLAAVSAFRVVPERELDIDHATAFVGRWLQSFREFPPRQKPGSFNLDRVMEAVSQPHKGAN